ELFAIAAGAGAFAACLTALYSFVDFPAPHSVLPIRVASAILILVLTIAVFLSQPELTLWGLMVSRLSGGKTMRSLAAPLPIAITAIALLLVIGHRFYFLRYTVAFSALVVASLILPLLAVFSSSRKLD